MDFQSLIAVVVIALVILGVARRLRRTFGRQPVNETRLYLRTGILVLIAVVMLVASVRDPNLLGALIGGVSGGIALGYLGLRHTVFESTRQGRFYTPHTYIGVLVTALFLGRLLYRFATMSVGIQAPVPPSENPLAMYGRSPLTVAIFGLLIGYYVVFNLGVLGKSRYPAMVAPD